MDKKIIKNFLYNTGYQVLTLILPFITIPYVSRIFNPEQIGIYSSTYSMVQMFLIIGMFSVGSYGVKVIAANRDDKEKLAKKFYEIRYMQKITMIISIMLYFILFMTIDKNINKVIYIIQSINLIAGLIDISWLFIGLEDFKKTVIRNVMVKIGSLGLIFIFVKKSSDLWLYTLILATSMFFGNLSMWRYLKEIININIDKSKNLKNNLIMAFSLLIPQIAFQIYTSFDRTILGIVNSMEAVGMYDQSQKIIRMAVGIVTSLGIVMLPRITNMISLNKNKQDINELLRKSLNLTLFISLGCTFGILAISKNFVPWFYSEEYINVVLLLNITSIVCVLTAVGSFFSNQYAIPNGNKKAYIIPLVSAAIISILLTSILGSKFGAIGACISIVITESAALALRMVFLKDELDYKYLFKDLYIFIIAGVSMFVFTKGLGYIFKFDETILTTILEVIIGGSVYCLMIILLKREYIEYIRKFVFKTIKSKLHYS